MNWLDAAILAVVGLAVAFGWNRGFVRRACSLAGLVAAIIAITLILPSLLPADPVTETRAVVTLGLVWLIALAGSVLGGALGRVLDRAVVPDQAVLVNRAAGAALGFASVALLAWLVIPKMADVAGWPSVAARESTTAAAIDSYLGRPPDVFDELGRVLRIDTVPRIFEADRSPDIDRVPPANPVSAETIATVQRSVVRVEGVACRFMVFGSGFFVAPGIIATNAHVVAGTDDLTVHTVDGSESAGKLVYFDPDLDIALIRTPLADREPLGLLTAERGDVGTVLGFPGGGDLALEPFLVDDETEALGRDIYNQDQIERRILLLAATLEKGDSGGPLVSPEGEAIGMAVGLAPDRSGVAYGIVADDIIDAVDARSDAKVSSGPCT